MSCRRSLLACVLLLFASSLYAGEEGRGASDLAGTRWRGVDDGDSFSVTFGGDGQFTCRTGEEAGQGVWRQVGTAVYLRKNGGGVYLGELNSGRLQGIAWDRQREWKWNLRLGEGGPRPSKQSLAGTWSEDFGKPGETDVTYHDQYRVDIDADGTARVKPVGKDQEIADAKVEGNRLTFRLKTSFWIDYDLQLQADGETLVGTAKTPHKTVNITWHRVGTRPESGGRPRTTASVAGRWAEDFGRPGETDVTYHDVYQVDVDADGTVHVKMAEKEYKIDEAKLEGNRLTFKLHTSFDLSYDLKLQADGDTLVGTAVTPYKTVNITWRRVK